MPEGYSELDGMIVKKLQNNRLTLALLIRYVGGDSDLIRSVVDRLHMGGVLTRLNEVPSAKGEEGITLELTETGVEVANAFRRENLDEISPFLLALPDNLPDLLGTA